MKVKDIMTKKIVVVSPEDSIKEVADVLAKYKIHGVPVVKNKKVVGIIAGADFFTKNRLNVYLPSYINFLEEIRVVDTVPLLQRRKMRALLNARAMDIMTKNCKTVSEDADLKDLLSMYTNSGLYTLPVVNKKGEIVGVVTLSDLVNYLDIKIKRK